MLTKNKYRLYQRLHSRLFHTWATPLYASNILTDSEHILSELHLMEISGRFTGRV